MPLSAAHRAALKQLYTALADRVLTPDDPVYIADLNRHGDADPIADIATEIDWQAGGGVCLFTGQRGTGKSTELQRLKRELEGLGARVFYVDLSEYLLLSKEIEISDFLVSMAGAMSEQVQTQFIDTPGELGYWERFTQFLQSRVNIDEIKFKLPGAEIKAALKSDPDFKRHMQETMRGHIAQLVQETHAFFLQTVNFIRARMGQPDDGKVVLLVDSVERVRGVGNEAMKVYESVRNLFFSHAEHLCIPGLHVVYTVPPYLSVLAAGAGGLMGGATTRRLVSTHIFQDRSRQPDPAGLATLRQVVSVRHPDWTALFTPAALDSLALSSGGDLREFFRLIRLCLPAVRDDSQLPLDEAAVRSAQNAARNEMLPIPDDQLAWLQAITKTHSPCLKTDADLPMLAHFLDNRMVLNYRNGSDWYDVHPLLREVVDSYDPAARLV